MTLRPNAPFKPPRSPEAWLSVFLEASKAGDLKLVERLCSSEFKAIADIHAREELGFHLACNYGHLQIVKFLTTARDLLEADHTFVDIHADNEYGLRLACYNGHPEVVKFLTTSPELLAVGHTFVDIHANNPFSDACFNGHLEVVKFLTTSPELIAAGHTLVNIHENNEQGFHWACENAHYDIVQFLIFDLNLEKTPTIEDFINPYPQIQAYFNAREEQERFQQSLIESRLTLETPTNSPQDIKPDASFRI